MSSTLFASWTYPEQTGNPIGEIIPHLHHYFDDRLMHFEVSTKICGMETVLEQLKDGTLTMDEHEFTRWSQECLSVIRQRLCDKMIAALATEKYEDCRAALQRVSDDIWYEHMTTDPDGDMLESWYNTADKIVLTPTHFGYSEAFNYYPISHESWETRSHKLRDVSCWREDVAETSKECANARLTVFADFFSAMGIKYGFVLAPPNKGNLASWASSDTLRTTHDVGGWQEAENLLFVYGITRDMLATIADYFEDGGK